MFIVEYGIHRLIIHIQEEDLLYSVLSKRVLRVEASLDTLEEALKSYLLKMPEDASIGMNFLLKCRVYFRLNLGSILG